MPGLHRWTADVPDWTPDQGGPEGWAQEVACVAWEGEGALVLVDPLVDEGDWGAIDALVERHWRAGCGGRDVSVARPLGWGGGRALCELAGDRGLGAHRSR